MRSLQLTPSLLSRAYSTRPRLGPLQGFIDVTAPELSSISRKLRRQVTDYADDKPGANTLEAAHIAAALRSRKHAHSSSIARALDLPFA
jgi:hypothetical protein